jgi:hypothetical protein
VTGLTIGKEAPSFQGALVVTMADGRTHSTQFRDLLALVSVCVAVNVHSPVSLNNKSSNKVKTTHKRH